MLVKINPDQFEVVRPFFPRDYPNLAFVLGTLDQKIKGEVWIDDPIQPQSAMIISGFYVFIAGIITEQAFTEYLLVIKEKIKLLDTMSNNVKTNLSLICPPEMLATPINFAELGFVTAPRVEYEYKQETADFTNKTEYDLLPIDDKNIASCRWYQFVLDIIGANNINHHLGYMLWDNKTQCVVSEAHGFVGGDVVEIGTVTHPDYTKKGLSTSVCARLIVEATKKGLHPLWSCSIENLPSNKTALSLGMEPKQGYYFQNIGNKPN